MDKNNELEIDDFYGDLRQIMEEQKEKEKDEHGRTNHRQYKDIQGGNG